MKGKEGCDEYEEVEVGVRRVEERREESGGSEGGNRKING